VGGDRDSDGKEECEQFHYNSEGTIMISIKVILCGLHS
jgi:hypothetical protein